jgi:hypothetical protein
MGDKLITRPVSIEDSMTEKLGYAYISQVRVQDPRSKCSEAVKTIKALNHMFHQLFCKQIQVCCVLQ